MNKQQKKLTYIFILLFIILFFTAFWSNVYWVFNYRMVSELITGAVNSSFSPPISGGNPAVSGTKKPNNLNSQIAGSILQIPKLDISAPIVEAESNDIQVLSQKLDEGVVYYPGSVFPGENGQIAILGHSAPPGWPKIKYDWVFSEIDGLNLGDKIIINSNGERHTYSVTEKKIVQVGEDISKSELSEKENVLTLISCWPPGKNYKRIVVHSQLEI